MNFAPITQRIKRVKPAAWLFLGIVLATALPVYSYMVKGSQVQLDTTNFDVNLSSSDTDVQTALETLEEVAGAGGDSIFVGGAAVANADFNNTSPAAPGGGVNVKWQNTGSGPASISAYITESDLTLDNLGGTLAVSKGGTGATTASAARTNLGLVIGSNVQAYSAVLDIYAGISPPANVQSILGAADYAAIRGLLDLEPGTDFYSVSAADSAFVDASGGDTMAPKLTISDSASTAPLNVTERSSAPSIPASGDIYLDDGSNTGTGNPGWRRYAVAAWEDLADLGYTPANESTTMTIAGTANQVTSSAGAQDLSTNRTWTLSLPQDIHTGASPQFTGLNIGHATDTTVGRTAAGRINVEGTNVCLEDGTDCPAGGAGDVTGVGDCPSGACYDGSSDGGSYVRLYDGDSHYMQLGTADISGANKTINLGTMTDGKLCGYTSTGTVIDCDNDPAAVGSDSIGTVELDDGADTPGSGQYIRVDTVDQAGIEYRTAAETRADLDLEAGTDFYSISGADAAFQPLDAVLTDLAALSAVADNEIIVGTGAGTYAHESGATARTSLGVAIGTNVQAWDAELDTIAALTETNGGVMFVAGGAWTTDTTPAIDCTDCTNIPAGSEDNDLETDGAVGIADTEIFIGTGAGTGNYAALSGDVTMANTGAVTIGNDKILESMLKAVDAPSDEECLTYETTTGDFEWQTCGAGGSGATTLSLPIYSAKLTGDFVVFTPPTADACTQGMAIDAGEGPWRLLADATTDECVLYQFVIPDNYSSAPKLEILYSMASATTGTVEFEGAIMCVTGGDAADVGTASFSNVAVATETVPGTAGHSSKLTITLTDDSCAAGDLAFISVSKDSNDGTNDTATGDTEIIGLNFTYTGS